MIDKEHSTSSAACPVSYRHSRNIANVRILLLQTENIFYMYIKKINKYNS